MALRRQVKNVVKNFSDIEVKVREATSNDPWGPSSSLTSEIADATYNVQAFTETMQLLWKRINDHGKNWRHVYKSLVVLDYIVKTGSERVAQQCRENIFAIKTLKDFQFIDKDGKDQGINVREKSKQLVALLKDEERLKSERQRALKAKERFYQAQGGIGNLSYPKNKKFQGGSKYTESGGSVDDSNLPSRTWPEIDPSSDSRSTDGRIDSEIEKVRPSNEAEEEMQLQIALAMSREEAEKDGASEGGGNNSLATAQLEKPPQPETSTLLNLTDATLPPAGLGTGFDPWVNPQPPAMNIAAHSVADPWGESNKPVDTSYSQPKQTFQNTAVELQPASDPWSAHEKPVDPWGAPVSEPVAAPPDPWGLPTSSAPTLQDPFASVNRPLDILGDISPAFTPNITSADIDLFDQQPPSAVEFEAPKQSSKDASNFLSNGSHLVDVDNILAKKEPPTSGSNPFQLSGSSMNPFLQEKPKAKSINEMRNDKTTMFGSPGIGGDILVPTSSVPANDTKTSHNPFL